MPLLWEMEHEENDLCWPARHSGQVPSSPGTGFLIQLEDGSGFIHLEDGSGFIELENGP